MSSRPQDRYVKLETKKLPNGRVVYKSTRPIKVTVDELTDIKPDRSDVRRFDTLAYKYLNSAQSWWRIASANNLVNGSINIPPNRDIIIPRG
jgi:hypothetical protein